MGNWRSTNRNNFIPNPSSLIHHFVLPAMNWITRERPKIDRIACPWLIKNFVDSSAEFIYVPKDKVFDKAKELNAIPYDLPGAEYTHEGQFCTFDYIVKKHQIID